MSNNNVSKKRRVMDYLGSGKTLTANEAKSRFGVANLRACVTSIRTTAEAYGNWEVTSDQTTTGLTRYGMEFVGYTDNPHAIRCGAV